MTAIVTTRAELLAALRATDHAHQEVTRQSLRYRWFEHVGGSWVVWASDNLRMVRFRLDSFEQVEPYDRFGIDLRGCKRMAAALRSVPIREARIHHVTLTVKDGRWELRGSDWTVGGTIAPTDVAPPTTKALLETFHQDREAVLVNPAYLAQAAGAFATESTVWIRPGGPKDPVWMTASGGKVAEVIMPIDPTHNTEADVRLTDEAPVRAE